MFVFVDIDVDKLVGRYQGQVIVCPIGSSGRTQARTPEEDGDIMGVDPVMECQILPFNLLIGIYSSLDEFWRRTCFAQKFFSAMKDLRPHPAEV